MNNETRTVRKKEMEYLRFDKLLTLAQIGEIYGISRERVRQLIGNTGKDFIGKIRKQQVFELPNLTNNELAEKLNLSYETVCKYRSGTRHAIEKNCNCYVGAQAEEIVSKKLIKHKIPNKLMPANHPFDILLDNGIKIDVKSRKPVPDAKGIFHYQIDKNKTKNKPQPDFYALVINNDVYFIPGSFGGSCIAIPVTPVYITGKKWNIFKNNFDSLMI